MTRARDESTLLVHKPCNSQLTDMQDGPLFCEVCDTAVGPEETSETDNSPGPFSG